jgi:cytochrome c-type biogenesis protein CcmH/NrfG
VLAAQDKGTEAVAELERALVLRPDDVDAHRVLGQIYASRRDDRRAVEHLGRAVELAGSDPALLTQLAAILADSRDVTVRDAPRALALADRAVTLTGRRDPFALDVLSVSQAAMARFAEAAETAREGLVLAREQGQQALVNELEYRANAYAALAR